MFYLRWLNINETAIFDMFNTYERDTHTTIAIASRCCYLIHVFNCMHCKLMLIFCSCIPNAYLDETKSPFFILYINNLGSLFASITNLQEQTTYRMFHLICLWTLSTVLGFLIYSSIFTAQAIKNPYCIAY